MKKTYFIVIVLLFPVYLFSQGFKGGINIGLCPSQIDGDASGGFNKLGFMGGFFVKRQFSEKSGIHLGLNFASKGSKESLNKDSDLIPQKITVNYIEIPVLYDLYYKKFIFEFGLVAGVFVSAKHTDNYGSVISKDERSYNYNKFDLCPHIGMNYFYTKRLGFNFALSHSVLPINGASPYWYNSVLTLAAIYKFKE